MSTASLPAAAPLGRDEKRFIALGALGRLAAFAPLCLLGLLGWTTLVDPASDGAAWGMTFAALLAALALRAGARLAPAARRGAQALVVLALLATALLCAGVPLALLAPERWDELVAGVAEGLRSVPAIASPYRGGDQWIEITVLLGGTLLAAIAALQSFWPSSDGNLRSPVPAAMTMTLLYGVAVIEVPPERPFLSGALFAALLAAFLFADRISPSQAAPAAVLVTVATLLAAGLAPAVDRDGPWIDLEKLSEDVANTGTVGYSWDHSYSPLDWPRDGRELLRIKAGAAAYWKAQVLDNFDGHAWHRTPRLPPFEPDGEMDEGHPNWQQKIRVRVKGLRSEQFVLAGQTLVVQSRKDWVRTGGGTYVVERGLLRRGMSYGASVYTPDPTRAERARAGTHYPSNATQWLTVEVPDERGRPRPGEPGKRLAIDFAPFGSGEANQVTTGRGGSPPGFDVNAAVAGSGLERIYALARSLRADANRPYDYVEAVLARVQRGALYTEDPPASENPLDTFLFDERRGYCQHFSGAMALLLRMGGVPARVAVGFTPGQLDRGTREYVVRDYDAHSWVEAYFPRLGWVTLDPTPAAAPPREQVADRELGLGVRGGGTGDAGDRLNDPESGAAGAASSGTPWLAIGGVVLTLALVALVALAARRRVRRAPVAAELAELERALRISGRPAAAGVTLADLEQRLGTSPEARDYLRAIAAQRFAAHGRPPTERQRRAMRRELASGLGRSGRLRAWWAMPPRAIRALTATR